MATWPSNRVAPLQTGINASEHSKHSVVAGLTGLSVLSQQLGQFGDVRCDYPAGPEGGAFWNAGHFFSLVTSRARQSRD